MPVADAIHPLFFILADNTDQSPNSSQWMICTSNHSSNSASMPKHLYTFIQLIHHVIQLKWNHFRTPASLSNDINQLIQVCLHAIKNVLQVMQIFQPSFGLIRICRLIRISRGRWDGMDQMGVRWWRIPFHCWNRPACRGLAWHGLAWHVLALIGLLLDVEDWLGLALFML